MPMNIYVWPDYSWCEVCEYEGSDWRGDDYLFVQVPDDRTDDVDSYLNETRPQDLKRK